MSCKAKFIRILICLSILVFILSAFYVNTFAANAIPSVGINIGTTDDPEEVASSLQLLFLLSIISLAPSLLIMFTCFTRLIIVLHFLRSALGTQQMPPNQILIGLALVLTFFLMGPTLTDINNNALQPYSNGLIGQEEALIEGMRPIREFMFSQVETKDMALFAGLSGEVISLNAPDEISNRVLIPAFILGELTKGFKIGFLLYIPFIVIDMVVASVLMAMGMMMLPPAMISLPFKILLFIMANGWSLVLENLVRTF